MLELQKYNTDKRTTEVVMNLLRTRALGSEKLQGARASHIRTPFFNRPNKVNSELNWMGEQSTLTL